MLSLVPTDGASQYRRAPDVACGSMLSKNDFAHPGAQD
jgi:hypothetical protein